MGHIKPCFLPTQKEDRAPFHFVARHCDPVLKQVARGTLKPLVIKFSGLSQENGSSRFSIHGQEKTVEKPHADRKSDREKETGSLCLDLFKKN